MNYYLGFSTQDLQSKGTLTEDHKKFKKLTE